MHWLPLSLWIGWTEEQREEYRQQMNLMGRSWGLALDEDKGRYPRNSRISDVEEYQGEQKDIEPGARYESGVLGRK